MKNGFAGRTRVGIVGGKYEIPWPQWTDHFGYAMCKDYRMNGFPRAKDGTVRYKISDDEYLSWMADYLPGNLPELTYEQKRLRDAPAAERDRLLNDFRIGDCGAWYEHQMTVYPIYDFPDDFGETGDFSAVRRNEDASFFYEEYAEEHLACFDGPEEPDEPLMTEEEFILEAYACQLVRKNEEQQFARYWPQFYKFNSFNVIFTTNCLHSEPPDAGWRVYLGLALQRIHDKQKRIDEIEKFYHFWHEVIVK